MIICPWKDLGRYAPIIPGLEEAMAAVNALPEFEDKKKVALSGGNRFFVTAGTTGPVNLGEAHRQYLDIQYVVKGSEVMGWADVATCTPAGEFNTETDGGLYSGDFTFYPIQEGMCYVVFPEDAHMPARHLDAPTDFVKVVIKLKV